MHSLLKHALFASLIASTPLALAEVADVPTRPGVTNRVLIVESPSARAVALLYAGGHGGLQIDENGTMRWGQGNFVVRTRDLWATEGFDVLVVDAPSDRQASPFLDGFRLTEAHAQDAAAIMAWARKRWSGLPVWIVGTSRGTQSAASIAIRLPPAAGGPDGIGLTSSILTGRFNQPVPRMDLDTITVPVLVEHHRNDECGACPPYEVDGMVKKLKAPHQLIWIDGGTAVGDPCEARGHHGYNGVEAQAVHQAAAWMLAQAPAR